MLFFNVPNVPFPLVLAVGVFVSCVLHLYVYPPLLSAILKAVMAVRTTPSFTLHYCITFPVHVCGTKEFTIKHAADLLASYILADFEMNQTLTGKIAVEVSYNKGPILYVLLVVGLAVLVCMIGVMVRGFVDASGRISYLQGTPPNLQGSQVQQNPSTSAANNGQPPAAHNNAIAPHASHPWPDTTVNLLPPSQTHNHIGQSHHIIRYEIRPAVWNALDDRTLRNLGITRTYGGGPPLPDRSNEAEEAELKESVRASR